MSVVQQAPLCLLIEVTMFIHIMPITCNCFISLSPGHLDAVIICCLFVMYDVLLRDILEGRMLGKHTRGRKRLQPMSNISEGTSYKTGSQWPARYSSAPEEEEEEGLLTHTCSWHAHILF